jgi:hypothetical protein
MQLKMAETRPLGSVLYFYTLPNGRVSASNCVTSKPKQPCFSFAQNNYVKNETFSCLKTIRNQVS